MTTIDDASFENLKDESILQTAALLLRKSIMQIEKKILLKNNSMQLSKEGEVSLPQNLLDFYFTFIGGCNRKRKIVQNVYVKFDLTVKI